MAKSGWFASRNKQSEEEERQLIIAQRREAAKQKLIAHVKKLCADPRFQVTTFDGLNWIHPYNGSVINCPFDLEQTVFNNLIQHQPWKAGNEPLALEKLTQIAWIQFLMQHIESEEKLRIMSDNNWLDPFSGTWVESVPLDANNRLYGPSLLYLSKFLNGNPNSQQREFLSSRELDELKKTPPGTDQQAFIKNLTQTDDGILEDDTGFHLDLGNLEQETQQRGSSPSNFHPPEDELPQENPDGELGEEEFDLQRAKEIQAQSCGELPKDPRIDMSVLYEGYSQVSGDFYTVIPLSDTKYFMMVGDVSGHGVQAALVVAGTIRTLRLLSKRCHDLLELISELNDEIKPEILSSQFITAFAGIYDTEAQTLTFILAGHHPCLMINLESEQVLERLGEKGMAIGLLKGPMFSKTLKPITIQMGPGDCLVQYSDGIIEAMDNDSEEYGHHRTAGSLLCHSLKPLDEMIAGMANDVKQFCNDDIGDDLTIFALRIPYEEAAED